MIEVSEAFSNIAVEPLPYVLQSNLEYARRSIAVQQHSCTVLQLVAPHNAWCRCIEQSNIGTATDFGFQDI